MKKLFYHGYSATAFNLGMLVTRVVFGLIMVSHGWQKLSNFSVKKDKFMDFMGIGSAASLGLATFAEFFCSLLLIAGLFTRLATIPLIITMLVIFHKHQWAFWGEHELVPALLAAYIAILLMGPGKYSLDAAISKR